MFVPELFQTQCLVLREHPSEHAVDAHACGQSWPRLHESARLDRDRPRSVVWQIRPGLTMHYLEDEYAPASFVFVRSQTPGIGTRTLNELRAALNPWSLDELIVDVLGITDTARMAAAIGRIVIAAPNHASQNVLGCLRTILDEGNLRVRQAAVDAAIRLLWPECRSILLTAAKSDPDRALRKYAKGALRNYDRMGIEAA